MLKCLARAIGRTVSAPNGRDVNKKKKADGENEIKKKWASARQHLLSSSQWVEERERARKKKNDRQQIDR